MADVGRESPLIVRTAAATQAAGCIYLLLETKIRPSQRDCSDAQVRALSFSCANIRGIANRCTGVRASRGEGARHVRSSMQGASMDLRQATGCLVYASGRSPRGDRPVWRSQT